MLLLFTLCSRQIAESRCQEAVSAVMHALYRVTVSTLDGLHV